MELHFFWAPCHEPIQTSQRPVSDSVVQTALRFVLADRINVLGEWGERAFFLAWARSVVKFFGLQREG
jgi:hypothetical protein